MSAIEVIRSADEHWWETRWNAVVKYKGEKYVICVMENPKWGDHSLHYYDESVRYGIGDDVADEQIYEAIMERLEEACCLDRDELSEGNSFFEDDEEE